MRGNKLSQVQELALVLLDVLQLYRDERRERDQMRRDVAMLGWASDGLAASWDAETGWLRYRQLFPDHVPQRAFDQRQSISSEQEIDEVLATNESGESQPAFYDFSQADPITEDEANRIINEIRAQSGSLDARSAVEEGWI